MSDISLNTICNVIILISAVIIAVKNIYGFLKKPVDDISAHSHNKEAEHIESIIEQRVPELLSVHDKELKKARQIESQEILEGLTASFNTIMDSKMNDIKQLIDNQSKDLININETLIKVKEAQKDVLRIRMNEIYYTYLPYQKIRDTDKKLINSLYNDYTSLNGNSWWEERYETISKWQVVNDEYEFET